MKKKKKKEDVPITGAPKQQTLDLQRKNNYPWGSEKAKKIIEKVFEMIFLEDVFWGNSFFPAFR